MRLLTLNDLYSYYSSTNKSSHFSASKDDDTIVVQVRGSVKFEQTNKDTEGLLPVYLQSCHIDQNINGSNIDEDVMIAALPSFSNRPILGYIHEVDGQYEFYGHNMHLDDDGNIVYDEVPVGVIPESCDAKLVYDEEKDKTYVEVKGYIFEQYSRAAEILEREGECSVSVELSIRELSYDAKNKYLDIEDFFFSGVTILGKTDDGETVMPGMQGSNIKLADFSKDNNSLFSKQNEKLVELLEKLNTTLESFQINITKEGGNLVNKFEELLQKYNKTAEDITFEYENLSDDELEAKFAEVFGEGDTDGEGADPEPASDGDEGDGVEPDNTEPEVDPVIEHESVKPSKYSIVMSDGTVKEFELSLDEINNALWSLVNDTYAEADDTYYGVSVYESHVIMHDWWNNKNYKQTYKREEDNFSLTGDRVEVFANWLTKDEESALADMRANYESLKQFKSDTEAAQLHAQREAILSDAKFETIADTEAFKALVAQMDRYSVAELEKEAKVILADNYSAQFSVETDKKSRKTIGFSLADPDKTEKPYGNLFD
jgi:hypothetical protein